MVIYSLPASLIDERIFPLESTSRIYNFVRIYYDKKGKVKHTSLIVIVKFVRALIEGLRVTPGCWGVIPTPMALLSKITLVLCC